MQRETINWKTLEYEHRERSPDWYWALGTIALSLSIASIIYSNYLFAIFIVLAALILIMYVFRRPEEFEVEINKKGVKIKKEFYPYKKLKSFWIEPANERKKLIIHTERTFMPHIIIPIESGLESDIRETLQKHIKEEEMHEPNSHKIMEYLGF